MRILYMGLGDTLIGRHLPQSWPDRLFGKGPERRVGAHEVLTFGYAPGLDIQIAHDATFADVLEQLPPDWLPDVCVCTHVDFLVIPEGIEHAPFPTVAITADWDFRIGIARSMAEAFDLTIALSEESCEAVQLLGARHAAPFAYFGVPEERLEGDLARIDRHRPIDVLFTGTIQDSTHLDRSLWLARLARLSGRYRVHIGEASSSQETYNELLKRAKLVFTFHRRGEIQLRHTDAVTQGALVLDNGVQTEAHFDRDREYLHYDDQNFEELIEAHLQDEELRSAKVAAARRRVAEEFGSVRRFEMLFDELAELLTSQEFGARPSASLAASEMARRRAEQHYANHFECSMGPSDRYLAIARDCVVQCEAGPRRCNDEAVIRYSLARHGAESGGTNDDRQASLRRFQRATEQSPEHAMTWFNAGYAHFAEGDAPQAARLFARAFELALDKSVPFDAWALYCHEQNLEPHAFKKRFQDALFASLQQGHDGEVRALIAANCAYFLARYRRDEGRFFDAHDLLETACELDPTRGEFVRLAAASADVLGYREAASDLYRRSLELLPLDIDLRLSAVDFMTRNEQLQEAKDLLQSTIQVVKGIHGAERAGNELRYLANAMRHAYAKTPVLREVLHDRFCAQAHATLLGCDASPPDARVERRVSQLLEEQGKTEALAAWRASMRPRSALDEAEQDRLDSYLDRMGAAGKGPVVLQLV
ncbi:MAG: glycosyltransferase [Planctomycetota bacterium]